MCSGTRAYSAPLERDVEATWEETRAVEIGERLPNALSSPSQPVAGRCSTPVGPTGQWRWLSKSAGQGRDDRRQRDPRSTPVLPAVAWRQTQHKVLFEPSGLKAGGRVSCPLGTRWAICFSPGGMESASTAVVGRVGNSHLWREVAQTRRHPFGHHQSQVRHIAAAVARFR